MVDVLLLVGGLAILTVAADRFVLGAARLSTALRVSPIIVGVIVIGFGTSAPETLVTVLAAAQGSADLAFGNLVGSNTANVLLVLGAAAVVAPIAVGVATLRREVPLMLAAVVALALATAAGRAAVLAGIALLAAAAVTIGLLVAFARADRKGSVAMAAGIDELGTARPSVARAALLALAGLLGTVAGAQMLVSGASGLAAALGISEAVIGLTVVAIGTSLPELVTGVAAARRGTPDLVIGNVLGSNLFNSLPIAGVAALLGDLTLDAAFARALAIMLFSCALAAFFLFTGRRLARPEGVVLLGLFVLAIWLTAT